MPARDFMGKLYMVSIKPHDTGSPSSSPQSGNRSSLLEGLSLVCHYSLTQWTQQLLVISQDRQLLYSYSCGSTKLMHRARLPSRQEPHPSSLHSQTQIAGPWRMSAGRHVMLPGLLRRSFSSRASALRAPMCQGARLPWCQDIRVPRGGKCAEVNSQLQRKCHPSSHFACPSFLLSFLLW